MAVTFKVDWQGERIVKQIEARTKLASSKGLQMIKAETLPLTPRDTGELQASCQITTDATGGSITFTAPHAGFVHERNLKYRSGGWKYLERGTRQAANKVLAMAAEQWRV